MFSKILIANRGEIACRIIRTTKKLNIKTVAIFSTADCNALHVQLADEAYLVGDAPSKDSYLNIDKIIEVAKQAQVEAIHPGYGFLSENPLFAKRCIEENIVFIGPSPEAMILMANKNAAKEKMQANQIPTLPFFYDEQQSSETLLAEANKIGFPVLLKAVAGGGGKGLRLIKEQSEFHHALEAVQREAKAFFNDERVMIEKYLAHARHIEVQIMGDNYGKVQHLYTRDCSIQRRHQKIIEEAPAPNLSPALQQQICATAVKAAESIKYNNAGTVEFLVEQDQFYFMEMNTRLQVEHPVTEMITGLDLVEWQIRIASGEKIFENQPQSTGHAIEVRLNAEDPDRDFLPSSGKLYLFNTDPNSRVDSGYHQGDQLDIYYDSLIAKIIISAEDRSEAIRRLHSSLEDTEILGIKTNLALLRNIINNKKFADGNFDTNFLQKNLTYAPESLTTEILSITAIYLYHKLKSKDAQHNEDQNSPWNIHDGWHLFSGSHISFQFKQHFAPIKVSNREDNFIVTLDNQNLNATLLEHQVLSENVEQIELLLQGQYIKANILKLDNKIEISCNHHVYSLEIVTSESTSQKQEHEELLTAPMPGTLVALHVTRGQKVAKGDKLLVIEAMKMEHTLFAPRDGLIKQCHYKIGDLVKEGADLLELE